VNTATEAPLNFEREPEVEVPEQEPLRRDLHTSVTRTMWQTHSMAHSVRDIVGSVLELATRLANRMRALADRDVDHDSPADFHERLNHVERQLERSRYAAPQHFNNGGSDESNWKTIALFVMGSLQVIIVAFLGYIHTTVTQTHDDVVMMKCKLDPQCRVVVSTSGHP